jgi:predicted TIM-barrel fold metal-dependent hydrolase
LARKLNEYMAGLIGDYPSRFGGFAASPLPDVEGALRELEYAVETLKLDGVVLLSNAQGRYLGDESFDELFTELDRRKLVVLIHPARPPLGTAEVNAFVEYPLDVARAVGNMVIGRILERFGGIRFIVAHAGGSLPFLGARFSMAGAVDFERPNFLASVFKALKKIKLFKRLYYDMAGVVDVYALRTLAKSIDPTHLLFGTNYMWTPSSVIPSFLEGLRAYDGFDDKALSLIERQSALKLFPRFRQSQI